jgi:uncharacterized membrane protein (UPF0127 family)
MNLSRPLAALATAVLAAPCAFAQQGATFATTKLTIGINIIHAEVAATSAQREQGLMFREKLGANEGMVFVWDKPENVCMWMKNTLIPLSVAFIGADGKIVNIEEMKAQTLDSHCGKKDVPFALEMSAGWFKDNHLKPGVKVEGLPGLK